MQKLLISLISGILFGFGLALAGMTDPQKVLAFLDITGEWDASLILVLAAAVGVTASSFHLILRRSTPCLIRNSIYLKNLPLIVR